MYRACSTTMVVRRSTRNGVSVLSEQGISPRTIKDHGDQRRTPELTIEPTMQSGGR